MRKSESGEGVICIRREGVAGDEEEEEEESEIQNSEEGGDQKGGSLLTTPPAPPHPPESPLLYGETNTCLRVKGGQSVSSL